ncbi:MAG: transcription-repair coupling factor, partial [Ruminococcaceae bacterium]|nr:transcription-repair coupling factor [Oscillospiraceae bacterium]
MLTFPLKQTTEYARLLNGVGRAGEVSALFGVPQIARAQILAALAEDAKRPVIAVCAGEAEATRFAEDLNTFGIPAEVFPARDFTLRPVEGQNREYEYRRLSVLGNLVSGRTKAVCVPAEAALQHTLPRDEFVKNTLTIKYAMDISPNELITRLYEAGYIRRFQVEGPGQFAVRGGIVDLYAPDMQTPHRIEFWGDSIDSIHTFDLMSQRREKQVKKIYLSPAREVLFGSCEKAAVLLRESVQKSKSIHKKQLEACMQA